MPSQSAEPSNAFKWLGTHVHLQRNCSKMIHFHQNPPKPIRTHRKPSKPTKTHQNPPKSIKTHQNHRKPSKSTKTHQNPSKPTNSNSKWNHIGVGGRLGVVFRTRVHDIFRVRENPWRMSDKDGLHTYVFTGGSTHLFSRNLSKVRRNVIQGGVGAKNVTMH